MKMQKQLFDIQKASLWHGVAFTLLAMVEVALTGCRQVPLDIQLLQRENDHNVRELYMINRKLEALRKDNMALEEEIRKCRDSQEHIDKRSMKFFMNHSKITNSILKDDDSPDFLRIGPAMLPARSVAFKDKATVSTSRFVVDRDRLEKVMNDEENKSFSFIKWLKTIAGVNTEAEALGKEEEQKLPVMPYSRLEELPLDSPQKGYWLISDLAERPLSFDLNVRSVEILVKGKELKEIGIAAIEEKKDREYFIVDEMAKVYPFNAPGMKIEWAETEKRGVYLLKVDFYDAYGSFRLAAGQRWALILPSGSGDDQSKAPKVPCDYLGTGDVRIAWFNMAGLQSGMQVAWDSRKTTGEEIKQEYLLGAVPNDEIKARINKVREGLSPAITFGLYGVLAD